MNDKQLLTVAAVAAVAAFLGYKLGARQLAAAQSAQAAPMDGTSWLMAGGWAIP